MPKVTVRCNAEPDCRQLRCLYALPIRTRHYQLLGIKGVMQRSGLRPGTRGRSRNPPPPTGRHCRILNRSRARNGDTRSATPPGAAAAAEPRSRSMPSSGERDAYSTSRQMCLTGCAIRDEGVSAEATDRAGSQNEPERRDGRTLPRGEGPSRVHMSDATTIAVIVPTTTAMTSLVVYHQGRSTLSPPLRTSCVLNDMPFSLQPTPTHRQPSARRESQRMPRAPPYAHAAVGRPPGHARLNASTGPAQSRSVNVGTQLETCVVFSRASPFTSIVVYALNLSSLEQRPNQTPHPYH